MRLTSPLRPLAVCSDRKSTSAGETVNEDMATRRPRPASDDERPGAAHRLAASRSRHRAMTVVFSTYQSIDMIAAAQKRRGLAGST